MTESGYRNREQSEVKHHAIKLYLQAAARIVGSFWNLKYVDCCAGPWESRQSDYSDTSFGIALEALRETRQELAKRKRFLTSDCLLIEKETNPFFQLEAFAKANNSPNSRVRAKNWDFAEHVADIVNFCSAPKTFSFVLIDPWGWKLVGLSRISPILKLKPGEVLINLMSSFILRFVNDKNTDLSDLLGEDFPELRNPDGSELEAAIVRKYCDLIRQEGDFPYVCALPVMKPDSDASNFYLIYATRNAKGVQVFKNVEKRTEQRTHVIRADVQQRQRQERSGNLELFEPAVRYREGRYQQLARDNQERAQSRVLELLQKRGEISYHDCWAEALQYPAVYENDLRSWLKEWEEDGSIRVSGRRFPREVLKRDPEQHRIVYIGPPTNVRKGLFD